MSDPVPPLNAALEGRYHIERELGEGGMATVYLAKDLRHNRNVALKVLKPELAAVVGAERFLAEIETTANLQHPHILPLFDSGEVDGFLFYVMPHVDGESLRERLDREKQLPVDEAIRIAIAAANALDHAHRNGVIHRDIKPANILLQDGEPVVADFGIALAVSQAGGGRLTETGLSVGTPYYMSPEQASADREPTAASDVYSLGCVLYETLTGDPPFTGSSAQAVLVKILTEDVPAPREARPSIPPHVDGAIRKSLERLPADRFPSAKAFARALADTSFPHGVTRATRSGVAGSSVTSHAAWAAAMLLTSAVAIWGWSRGAPDAPVVRFNMALADGQEMETQTSRSRLAISPDGSFFVYGGPAPNGAWQLWRRNFADLTATPIPGTEFGYNPFFSPDGSRLGFTIGSMTLRVVSLTGGLPLTVTDSVVGAGGVTWAPDGYLYADGTGAKPLYRVRPTADAIPEQASRLDTGAGEVNHLWPEALPSGRGILFTVDYGGTREQDIAVMDLESRSHAILISGGAYPTYSRSGHLLYVTADGTLVAVPFDEDALALVGDPVAIVDGLELRVGQAADVAISHTGTLMYTTKSEPGPLDELVWVDRSGSATPVEAIRGHFPRPALSPDGTRIAIDLQGQIWIKELPDGRFYRFTSEGGNEPAWSPDGQSIAFASRRVAIRDLFIRPADASGRAELLQDGPGVMSSISFSPDGRWFAYNEDGVVYASEMGADVTERRRVVAGTGDGINLAISPNGRWIAFESAEAGVNELAIAPSPFSELSMPIIPVGQGSFPVWSRRGNELFYRSTAVSMVSRRVSGDATPILGSPEVLFSMEGYVGSFDVDLTAQRFLMVRRPPGARSTPGLVVVQNAFAELERLVPR